MADKKDSDGGESSGESKGVVLLGPSLPGGGRKAIKIDSEGVHPGEMFKEGHVPAHREGGTLTRLATKPLDGNSDVLEVMDEQPIGRPAMVNSKTYRDNWDNIFGNKKVVGNA